MFAVLLQQSWKGKNPFVDLVGVLMTFPDVLQDLKPQAFITLWFQQLKTVEMVKILHMVYHKTGKYSTKKIICFQRK